MALGSVLPARVFRSNVATFFRQLNSSYDAEGKKQDLGYNVHVSGLVFALEYGVTSNLSMQIKLPVILRNKLSYEPSEFVKSKTYKDIANEIPSSDQVQDSEIILPYFDKAKRGVTGLGDIEIGILYNWFQSDRFVFSSGLGLRLPTGEHYKAKLMRPIGSGLYELGLRNNLDVSFLEKNLWLSFQHQGELALNQANNPTDDQMDPTKVFSDETKLTKEGLTHKVKLQSDVSFAVISDKLKFISTKVYYDFQTKAPRSIDNSKTNERSYLNSLGGGLSLSALPYKIPVSLDLDYARAVSGKSSMSENSFTLNLKSYLRI